MTKSHRKRVIREQAEPNETTSTGSGTIARQRRVVRPAAADLDASSAQPEDAATPATAPALTSPRLPIELIEIIAKILLWDRDGGSESVLVMSTVSRDFRTATAPLLFRKIDLPSYDVRIARFVRGPFERISHHLRSAKFGLSTSNKFANLQNAFLKKAGKNLRDLSIALMRGPLGSDTIRVPNRCLSDKLKFLELTCEGGHRGDPSYSFERGAVCNPLSLQLPSAIKNIKLRFRTEDWGWEGPKSLDVMEKQCLDLVLSSSHDYYDLLFWSLSFAIYVSFLSFFLLMSSIA